MIGRLLANLLAGFALIAGSVAHAAADPIAAARFAEPVERYGHFALGRPHEYARLLVTTASGAELAFELPGHDVFEDLLPRIVRLADDEAPRILAIVSARDGGARLMLLRAGDGRIAVEAQSAPIGTPMRWLNPVAVVDLDGDRQAEIAAVVTPHIGGVLKVFRRQGDRLIEIAALEGFSNHVYQTSELGLSAPASIDGRTRLLVPDASRRRLRIVALDAGRLVETGSCTLPAPVTGALRLVAPQQLSIGLETGRTLVDLSQCSATPPPGRGQ